MLQMYDDKHVWLNRWKNRKNWRIHAESCLIHVKKGGVRQRKKTNIDATKNTYTYLVALSRQPRRLFVTRRGRFRLLLRELGLQRGQFRFKHATQLVVRTIIVGGLCANECVCDRDMRILH